MIRGAHRYSVEIAKIATFYRRIRASFLFQTERTTVPVSLGSSLKSCFSSLPKLDFGKPRSGSFNVIIAKFVSSSMPEERDVGAAALECSPKFFRLASRDNWIAITGANENGKISEIPNDVRR